MKKYLIIDTVAFLLMAAWPVYLPVFYHKTNLSSQEQSESMSIYWKHGHGLDFPFVLNIKPTEKRIINGEQTYLFTGYGWFGIPVKKNRVYFQNDGTFSGHSWGIWHSRWWE